jgi:hypothetical protein
MKTSLPAFSFDREQFRLRSEMIAALAAIGLCGVNAVIPAYATPLAAMPRAVAVQLGIPGEAIGNSGGGAGVIVDGSRVAAMTWADTAKAAAAAPGIVFNPSPLDFTPYGGIPVGSTASFPGMQVSNPIVGLNETITGITSTGDFAFSSSAYGGCVVGTVLNGFGGPCTLDLAFKPLVAGLRTGQLIVTTDAPGTFAVNLSGAALDVPTPVVQTFPTRVVFGTQRVGTTSDSQFVEITNAGNEYLYFDNLQTIGDFALVPGNYYGYAAPADEAKITSTRLGKCNPFGTLAIGSTCVAEVTFTPTDVGVRNGSLYITGGVYDATFSNFYSRTTRVGLVGTGEGVPVRPLATPGTISFPEQYFGTQSDPIDFSITNTGPDPLEILEIVPTGDFSVTDDCAVLANGESCKVSARFQPTAVGPLTGQAVIRTLPDTGEYVVNLIGSGITNPYPVLLLSKGAIGYGNSLMGVANSVPVTLTSAGQLPLSLSKFYSLGDFFQTNDCPAILAPGLKCTINIGFLPSVLGPRRGEVGIESNAFGSPSTVILTGTACKFFAVAGQRIRTLQCLPGGF